MKYYIFYEYTVSGYEYTADMTGLFECDSEEEVEKFLMNPPEYLDDFTVVRGEVVKQKYDFF